MPRYKYLLLGLLCWMCGATLHAQITYNMSNQTVDDCEGILLDSDLGDFDGDYDHSENYTFTICINGTAPIRMDFLQFCTEEDFDYLRLFDGPDTLSTQIGETYSGEVDPPQAIATSGCLTVNFITDANVTCSGWEAHWYVEESTPVPPEILDLDELPCESNTVLVEFDFPIHCDSLYAKNFEIRGPQLPQVISTRPINCSGGKTRQVELTFEPPITRSGSYRVIYTYRVYNECGRLYVFKPTNSFVVNDCPLNVILELTDDEDLCAGSCTFIYADAAGGDSNSYSYTWAPAAPDSAYAKICPSASITYFVTVTDAVGGTAEASLTVTPNPKPEIEGGDRSFCQSIDPFVLTATTPGGEWSAMGIDKENEETGLYEPNLVTIPVDSVFYVDENYCEASIAIRVTPLNDGNDDASCPGEAPFLVSGGFPLGGEWSGEHITPDGLFTPVEKGSFPVTYTHPNGCAGTKMINVDSIQMPVMDTLCQSVEKFQIAVVPFGGEWTGMGIEDKDEGLFVPDDADPGSNWLHYEINGCSDSLVIDIKAIKEGEDISVCPEQGLLILPGDWGPAGGYWSGLGIVDSILGLYDPTVVENGGNDTLTFVTNGCVDTRKVSIRQTEIGRKDTLNFCVDEEAFRMGQDYFRYQPEDGEWRGAGIEFKEERWFFNPALAGAGTHTVYFEANTCADSIVVIVSERPVVKNYEVCVLDSPITLEATPQGKIWRGKGILNREEGIFDPSIAGVGTHRIINEVLGCQGKGQVKIISDEAAEISNLDSIYCFQDTLVIVEAMPKGGNFIINSDTTDRFNPTHLGSGKHVVKYEVGFGDCYSIDSVEIVVGESFEIFLPTEKDTVCYGDGTRIEVDITSDDASKTFTYFWDNGLGVGRSHLVYPNNTTTYTVQVSDGCREIQKGVEVYVHPRIQLDFTTEEAICFDDSASVEVNAFPDASYTYEWNTFPPTFGNVLVSYPTTYEVRATNDETGCYIKEEVTIPGYGLLKANFGYAPNVDCISDINPTIEILDFSVGAMRGYWDFGDGSARVPYTFGENLNHTFPDTGQYIITLHLQNEGNCISEYQLPLCIEKAQRFFAPNAFTPNYDGYNDVFQLKGRGISDMKWQVFNRWGQVLYEGHSLEDSWDGRHNGRFVAPGVYTYIVRYKTVEGKDEVMKGVVAVVY